MSENFRAEAWTEFEVHKYYIARKKWDWIKIEVRFIASAVCSIFYDSGNRIRISIWLLTTTLFSDICLKTGLVLDFIEIKFSLFGLKRPNSIEFCLIDIIRYVSLWFKMTCTFWTEESVQTTKSEIRMYTYRLKAS